MKSREKLIIKTVLLDEWRRKYDALDNAYDKVRTRSVTLLTIQLGLVGYFLSQLTILYKEELYGKIFFVMAASLLLYALYLSIRNYRAYSQWLSPVYELEIEKINNTSDILTAMDIILDDYKDSYDKNCLVNNTSGKRLNDSLYITIVGVIMLLVLNLAL